MPLDKSSPSPAWAGLTDPETGELRSFMPSDVLLPADRVAIDGDYLRFHWLKKGHLPADFARRRPPQTLLERFLGLHSDKAILRFAERFGPLAPRGLYGAGIETGYGPPSDSTNDRESLHRESLSVWRRHQSQLNALLTLVSRVRERESPAKETFAKLHNLGILPAVDRLTLPDLRPLILTEWERCSPADRLTTARAVFLKTIETYVCHCGLRPALTLEWSRTGSRMELVFQDARADFRGFGLSLFGALIVQLMSAATGSALAICSACGNFFVPRRRRPAFGKRRYCRMCGRAAAMRDAKAEYRAELRRLGVEKMSDLSPAGGGRPRTKAVAKRRSGK